MLSEKENQFTKQNLDMYLKELAKEFRKLNGTSTPAEIILIGGVAILANYGFRNATTDIDAIIHASSSMKEAVNRVGDKFNLPNGWINADFMRTTSYSSKLDEISVYYATFSNVLNVRTVSGEYLVAMKLKSGRKYKNDFSDIIGILAEHKQHGNPLTMGQINFAVNKLYGDWNGIAVETREFINKVIADNNYEKIYEEIVQEEKHTRDITINFNYEYPGIIKENNINEILENLKKRRKQ